MKTHELFVYLCVKDAAAAIDFYIQAFGATEKFRLVEPSGKVGHAEVDLDGHTVMIAEEFPDYGFYAPTGDPDPAVVIHLHVDDADAAIARGVELGAVVTSEPKDQFWGERSGTIRDPFGHRWNIGHDIEDITPEEMQRRYTEMLGK